jgi:hypothetical protein
MVRESSDSTGLAAPQGVVARPPQTLAQRPLLRVRAMTVTWPSMSAGMRPASGPGPQPSNSKM